MENELKYYDSKGYYILADNIYDHKSFLEDHKQGIEDLCDYALNNEHTKETNIPMRLQFGVTVEHQAFCTFEFFGFFESKEKFKEIESKFTEILKAEFPSAKSHIISLPKIFYNTSRYKMDLLEKIKLVKSYNNPSPDANDEFWAKFGELNQSGNWAWYRDDIILQNVDKNDIEIALKEVSNESNTL